MKNYADFVAPFRDDSALAATAPYRLTQPGYVGDPAHYAARRIRNAERSSLTHRLLHYFTRCEHPIAPPWRLVLRDDCGHWEEKPGVHLQCCICGLETIRRYDLARDPSLKFRAPGW